MIVVRNNICCIFGFVQNAYTFSIVFFSTVQIWVNVNIRVKFERVKRRYSQEKLAELAGIGRSTLAQIEVQSSSPTSDVVEILAKALEHEAYELLIFKNLEI